MSLLSWMYAFAVAGMALFGFNMLFLLALAVWHRQPRPEIAAGSRSAPDLRPPTLRSRSGEAVTRTRPPGAWPTVLVQLPVFNERYVVERLIDAAAALDYPSERLTIQVLDDSTDDTAVLAKARVAYHRARGKKVVYHHRTERAGFKAGALAEGFESAPGEFTAIFDADFVPPADFLRRTLPAFYADARLGMVQTRWDHLNAGQHALTCAVALALDGHFTVDQVARSRAGLLMNFNGSAGVWRRACIEEAGGWQGDTLAEDLDLSYRAQLKGWRMDYTPEVAVPAELTPSIMALKNQQFRWAKGSFQVLRKLGPQLLTARMPFFRKAQGFLHLGGYFGHPLILASLLLSLPVVLLHAHTPLRWDWLGWAGWGPPLVALYGQLTLRQDWPKRLLYYPVLVMVGIGLALANTHAIWEAFFGRSTEFVRTPKCSPSNQKENTYALPLDWTTWGELILALYALAVTLLAVEMAPGLAPFIFLYALGFGYTAALGFWQSGGVRRVEWQMTNDK